jgi:hypothetical protein
VIRAVDLISAVEPRMRRRELVFWLTYKRREPASEIPEGPIDPDLPAAGAEPEFDVARVLADL